MNIDKEKINQVDSEGRRHGRQIFTLSESIILMDGYCYHGKRFGLWKYYYSDGRLAVEFYCDNDMQEGEQIKYE